jgi:hypothetical protein
MYDLAKLENPRGGLEVGFESRSNSASSSGLQLRLEATVKTPAKTLAAGFGPRRHYFLKTAACVKLHEDPQK